MYLFIHLFTLTLSILPFHSYACLQHASLLKRQSLGINFTLGDSSPQPPATVGYNLNHLAITVPDLNATMDFYVNALGFRHIFTVPLGDKHSVTYLGYPHGGRNGTGYQTAEEMSREKNNAEGMLELLYSEVGACPCASLLFIPVTRSPFPPAHRRYSFPAITRLLCRTMASASPILAL